MNKKVIFLQDLFKEHHTGGAELNDDTFIQFLDRQKILYEKKQTQYVTPEYIAKNKDKFFIVSNFVNLSTIAKACMYKNCDYALYEHDYKFLKCRNPIFFPDFKAPAHEFTNINFYKGAKKVICLSKMHMDIFADNMPWLDNLININCSLFDDDLLEYLGSFSEKSKTKKYAVIKSGNRIKRTAEAVEYCQKNNLEYELISSPDNREFLKKLSDFEYLIVMTGHPEPTPRIVVEAKSMNTKILGQKHLIGVASEYWYHLNGRELTSELRNIREKAFKTFLEIING